MWCDFLIFRLMLKLWRRKGWFFLKTEIISGEKGGHLTLQGTYISPKKWHFEDDFPFPKVGYVNSLEGIPFQRILKILWV